MNYRNLIRRTLLQNTDKKQKLGNRNFDTRDYVFIVGSEDKESFYPLFSFLPMTDYALMNNGTGVGNYFTRKAIFSTSVYGKGPNTFSYIKDVCDNSCGIRPSLNLNISFFTYLNKKLPFKFQILGERNSYTNQVHHYIQFGEMPKTKVVEARKKILDEKFNKGKLNKTNKTYLGWYNPDNGNFVKNLEYELDGQKYVRTFVKKNANAKKYKDGSPIDSSYIYEWTKVEPLIWDIKNWDELPSNLNPNGTGSANYIKLETKEIVMSGIPFYHTIKSTNSNDCNSMWQNSCIRAYLNGYDIYEELENGNGNMYYRANHNFDFKSSGFIREILDINQLEKIDGILDQKEKITTEHFLENDSHSSKTYQSKDEANPYNFSYDNLSNDDLLKLYIKSNTSVFLHGPFGVGKSDRVRQIDPTVTRITLRPQMNPEEIDGVLDREKGTLIPPYWYTQLCDKCKKEPNRKHILFIDELINVKPSVQNLVYSIVVDRAGKNGIWTLPDNAVVVATGNEGKGNFATYLLTNELYRSFSHIYYDVDKESWINWATDVNVLKEQNYEEKENRQSRNRPKIHPAILSYILSKDESILYQEVDEENPKIVTDPRKWEIASEVLYSTKNPKALKPAIGEELTKDFTDFVKNIKLSVKDVLQGNFDKEKYRNLSFEEKYATILGLIMAKEKDVNVVRSFIKEYLGKEILTAYDSIWIMNNPERAQFLAESYTTEQEENLDGKQY